MPQVGILARPPRYDDARQHFRGWMVRTNIEIDDKLLAEAMRAGGFKTKRATVEAGLRLLIRRKAYRDILTLRGKIHWVGGVDTLRKSKRRLAKGTSI